MVSSEEHGFVATLPCALFRASWRDSRGCAGRQREDGGFPGRGELGGDQPDVSAFREASEVPCGRLRAPPASDEGEGRASSPPPAPSRPDSPPCAPKIVFQSRYTTVCGRFQLLREFDENVSPPVSSMRAIRLSISVWPYQHGIASSEPSAPDAARASRRSAHATPCPPPSSSRFEV